MAKPSPPERKKLPIPLTCSPQIQDGKCVYGFDNGACKLPEQFMCPYYLWFEKTHPEKIGDAPKEMLDRIRAEQPISLKVPTSLMQIRVKFRLKDEHGKNGKRKKRTSAAEIEGARERSRSRSKRR
jgi:hypothetical protein